MNTLILYRKHRRNTYSYYKFIRELIERFALEHVREIYFYKTDTDVSACADNSIFLLPLADATGLNLAWWYNVKLPAIARKLKAEKVLYINCLPAKKIRAPQTCIFTDVEFITQANKLTNYQKYLKKNLVARLKHAQKVITYSSHAKQILQNFIAAKTTAPEVEVIPAAANHMFMERSFNEKEIRKDNLTFGEEYFLAKIDPEEEQQFVELLKAFTVFKQWQKSNMKIVVSGLESSITNSLKRKAASYKFKDDVVILTEEHEDVYTEIISAAYAYLLVTGKDADIMPAVEAMQSQTLLMSYGLPSVKEIAGAAMIQLIENDYEALGRQMIEVYKNEEKREQQIEKGSALISSFDYETSKQLLFDLLLH